MSQSGVAIALAAALAAVFFSRSAKASAHTGMITTADDQAYTSNLSDPIYPGDAFLIPEYWNFPAYNANELSKPVSTVIDNPYVFDDSNSVIDISNALYDVYGFDFSNLDYSEIDPYVLTGDDMTQYAPPKPSGISLVGLDLLKTREGFSAVPYWDKKGYSIGYGHLIKPGEQLEHVTIEEATNLLFDDVDSAESVINRHVTADLTQNQYDALVSFVYNIGNTAFINSTMLRKLNAGDATAIDEFERWKYSRADNGTLEINAGLIDRRAQEKAQFASA